MKIWLTAVACMIATGCAAEVPRVVTDIAPVHSIVSAIMGDLGEVELIVPPAASPHDHAMRPSEARALSQANVVIWMGPALTPWLTDSIETLAPNAARLSLHDSAKIRLPFREGAAFEAHEHSAHDHAKEQIEETDPHMWLYPTQVSLWSYEIASVLSRSDPDNKLIYQENARNLTRKMSALTTKIRNQMEPLKGRPFVVFHDAFHYFESGFEVEAVGAISASNAQAPSPRRLREIQQVIEDSGAVCVFTEPQFSAGIVDAVAGTVKVGVIDPLGFDLELGPDMYGQLLTQIADGFETCLAE